MINVTAIHGVIGSDLLVEFGAVINLKKHQLRLTPEVYEKKQIHPDISGE
jgi:hypothetical protein